MSARESIGDQLGVNELIQLIETITRTTEPIDGDTPVISSGIVDSFDMVALLSAFESHYGALITSEDINVEYFDTPRQMLKCIEAARG